MKIDERLNKILRIMKYPLTLAILYLVLRKIDLSRINEIIKNLEVSIILILLLVSFMKIGLQYVNWNTFLRLIPDLKMKNKDKILSFFAGITFRMLSPGGVGVYGRMFFIPSRRRDSFVSITYEKFIQSWCLIFFASIAAGLYFENLALYLKLLLPVLALCLPFVLFTISPDKKIFQQYLHKYRQTLMPVLLIQIMINTLTIFQYYIFFNSFLYFSFYNAVKSVPLVQFANLIPVTVSGLGIREYLAIKIYPTIEISQEIAVACSLFIFFLSNILPAITGIFLLIFVKISKRDSKANQRLL
jgi:glycosyltransferase 2 family protein